MGGPLLNTYNHLPLTIHSAKGLYLYDDAGNAYLDMQSGYGVNALGHNHDAVMQALKTQSQKHLHISNAFLSAPTEALANQLITHSEFSKVFFANSGTEANEAALKLAKKRGRQISDSKTNVIALNKGFHGRTAGGMALTGKPQYWDVFKPNLPGVYHVDINDSEAFKSKMNDDVCAIFVEVIQGEGGIRPLTREFALTINDMATRHNALIIVDEVQTGLMRTGELFAYQHTPLTPNIITLAKALGGGIPLGAMLVDASLRDVFEPGDHGTTFGGNPLACAMGEAVIQTIVKPSFKSHVNTVSTLLFDHLQALKAQFPDLIDSVRGQGLMIGVVFHEDVQWIKKDALKHGVIVNVTASRVLRLLPPLTLDTPSAKHFINVLKTILERRQKKP